MLKIILIFIISLYAIPVQQQDNKYPKPKLEYADGRPTTLGIDLYVNNGENQKMFIREFENYVKDTIYNDMFFKTTNFKKYFKGKKDGTSTLAINVVYTNASCEINVNNEEKYKAIDYKILPEEKKQWYDETNYFLKATVFHEISHYYFYQIIMEMERIRQIDVNNYYSGILTYPSPEMTYGAKFIEEGICEYLVHKWGLAPKIQGDYRPKTKDDIIHATDDYSLTYGYSSQYIQDFLDIATEFNGRVKYGIMIILQNRPPSYQEILNPQSYFDRLKLLN